MEQETVVSATAGRGVISTVDVVPTKNIEGHHQMEN